MTRALLSELLLPATFGRRASVALLLLRVFVGAAFWFHGSGKASHLAAFAEEFHTPLVLAAAAAYTQIAGAVLLIAGAFTPIAAFGLASTMTVAVAQLIGRGEPFVNPAGHSWEAAAFYLTANIALTLMGPGRWSVDSLLYEGIERYLRPIDGNA